VSRSSSVDDRSTRPRGPGVGVAALIAVLVLIGASCDSSGGGRGEAGPAPAPPVVDTVASSSPASVLCAATATPGGTVAADDLVETSGIVASRTHESVLWAHNDSGGGPEVFAVGLDGADLGRVDLAGADSVDWEDIAILPGSGGGPDQLLVADTGDNPGSGSRTSQPVRLYRVDEPSAPGLGAVGAAGPVTPIDLSYADGPRDAEALLVDPLTGDAFVVSKQWDGAAAGVYLVPAAVVSTAAAAGPVTVERAATASGTEGSLVTAGDISPDGRAVVLRTYTDLRIWDRDPASTVGETVNGAPTCVVSLLERQGEAVAVLADGSGLVTVSEGGGAPVLVRRSP